MLLGYLGPTQKSSLKANAVKDSEIFSFVQIALVR